MDIEEQKTNYIEYNRLHCNDKRGNILCVHDKATDVLPANGKRNLM